MCHSDPSLATEKNGKQVSLYVDDAILEHSPHARLVCVACHVGFDPEAMPHKAKITPVNCRTCHAAAMPKHQFHPNIAKASGLDGSPDVSCKTCHGKHDVLPLSNPNARFNPKNLVQGCGSCHEKEAASYAQSVHGVAVKEGLRGAPTCLKCHDTALLRVSAGRDTVQVKIAQEKLCLSCHLDDPDVRARTAPSAGFIAAYDKSVHGAALHAGNAKAANCVDCHGSHDMQPSLNPAATINKAHIPRTCGKCHTEIKKEYSGSVHGVLLAEGSSDVPVCTTCHGEHDILSPSDPRSPVAPLNVSGQVCSPCHQSVRLSEKYDIRSDRFKTFSDSYHGLATESGSVEVANCASCHGAHDIKPSSDPTSSINKANLAKTCGRCHPGANKGFAVGAVHVTMSKTQEPILYWVATFYLLMIGVVIGGMFIHNAADFYRKARRRLELRRGKIVEQHHGHRLYLRMSANERVQHALVALSFILLSMTGFMLHYPEAWWVVSLRDLSRDTFELRGLLHRAAGVVLIAVSLYHVYYVMFTERGRQLIRDLAPRLQDVRDAIATVKYNFGFSKEKPLMGRFSYIEKSEYWALVWGTVVMGATGIILWFDNTFLGLLTKLGWDVSRTIHFFEAWLAVLAIIVWHFYYVIFNPDVYPVNLAFFKGTITEEEMADEHPLELEEIRRREGSEGMIEVKADTPTNKRNR